MPDKKKPERRGHDKHWANQPKKPIVCSECRTFQGHKNNCSKSK